ncbi:MAG: putative rane protein [Chloroflexota bacterium]|jgi:putative membrane protein|nr:putative rane protein [Chloroflexota bacterium]
MVSIIATVVGTGLALWITSLIYKEISFGAHPQVATVVVVAAILGLANAVFKPIIKALSLPLTLLTFGLFGLIVNGLLLLGLAWVADALGLKFTVGGFPPKLGLDALIAAVVGGVILSIVSTVIGFLPVLRPSR